MAVSATHYVEVISVKSGPAKTIQCGGCQIPGSGSWDLVAAIGKTWFNKRTTFRPGRYRVTYLGGTKIIKRVCAAPGDFTWTIGRVSEPFNSSTGVDLTKWTASSYKIDGLDQHHSAQWVLDSSGVTQLYNGEVAFFVSDFALIDQTFKTTIRVGDPQDDYDVFGIAWGLVLSPTTGRPDHFYVLEWKRSGIDNHSHGGLRIARVVNSGNQSGWGIFNRFYYGDSWTDGVTQIAIVAASPDIPWEFNTSYDLQVTYKSDGTAIITATTSTGALIWQTTYKDAQPLGVGRIAFYNLSQSNTHYSIVVNSSKADPIYYSPQGSICVADKASVAFNGQSDDIVILYQADDDVAVNYSGTPGDPYTFILPLSHVIFKNTSGFILGVPNGVPNAPKTAAKTFQAPGGVSATTDIIRPDIFSSNFVLFNGGAIFPAGIYNIHYAGGAMRFGQPQWSIQGFGTNGFAVCDGSGITIIRCPEATSPSGFGFDTEEECEAANAGQVKHFTLLAPSQLGISFSDSLYSDNQAGENDSVGTVPIGTPRWYLVQSNYIYYTFPEGSYANYGGGMVSDMIPAGFNVKAWGELITVNELHHLGWVDNDTLFRFKMAYIPCGQGNVSVTSVTGALVAGGSAGPVVTLPIWKLVEEVNSIATDLDDLPTVVGDFISFTLEDPRQIGTDIVQSPSGLINPKFLLENIATVINNPMQVVFVQQNPGGRYYSCDFIVQVGSRIFSTQVVDDTVYFTINGERWKPGNKVIPPLGQVSIALLIPYDTIETYAAVTAILNGNVTGAVTKTAQITPRIVTRHPLVYDRDLISSSIPQLTAKVAAFRKGVNIDLYTSFLYTQNTLVPITWDVKLNNSNVLVCIANDVIDSAQQVAYHLQTTKSILPHRHVQRYT